MPGRFRSSDIALARRIEAGHADSTILASNSQDSGSAVEAIAGGWAVILSADSPFNQAVGIGMSGPVPETEMDRLERFYHERGSPAIIDLCALADPSALIMVQQRGYVVREMTNVLVRGVESAEPESRGPGLSVEPVDAAGIEAWARLVMRGFLETDEIPEDQAAALARSAPSLYAFFGLIDGERLAGAAMEVQRGLATLFGDATLIPGRGRGLQLLMIRERLRRAAELGCDLASASVWPGTVSHRNYERAGFELVYMRVKVSLAKPLDRAAC